MTSSLVGSEMCIRDSVCVVCVARVLGCGCVSARVVEELLQPLFRSGRAVSYTHLTLPTICSV
eukprot:7353036-Prorocentrum_lima.AAC.1